MKKDNKPVLNHMFVSGIRELIIVARSAVTYHVNTIQVLASFEIGFRIVEQEQSGEKRAAYGTQLIPELSAHLLREFGKGFSERNLRNMRKFYLTYQHRYQEIRQKPSAKSQTESGDMIWQKPSAKLDSPFKLGWSQYLFLCGIDDTNERDFYEIESMQNSWTLSELKRHSNTAIIDKLEHFLLELGKGFLFEARQKRFTFDEEHFFVDLVFYNRLLRCYVLIDLKLGKLTHQHLGQMHIL